ncbi:hypothetical protein DNTS_009290 [Danionella cerebrum]|uniref:Uncharacterized protein n=1 Tax=Danionella cerebrum TaxID=2873325 RepID=A0A553R9M7_9TELE|nr:hypothetical protein DNTS_009290 [Danionella translucida]
MFRTTEGHDGAPDSVQCRSAPRQADEGLRVFEEFSHRGIMGNARGEASLAGDGPRLPAEGICTCFTLSHAHNTWSSKGFVRSARVMQMQTRAWRKTSSLLSL